MIRAANPDPIRRLFCITALVMGAASTSAASAATMPTAATNAAGVLRIASSHSVEDTVARIKQSVEAKGIRYFIAIDQQQLGASARPWLPSAFVAAAALPYLHPQRRKSLLGSLTESDAAAVGWSSRPPLFSLGFVDKVPVTVV